MKDVIFVENVIINFKLGVVIIEKDVLSSLKININKETGGVLYGFKLKENNEYVICGCTKKQNDDESSEYSFYRKDKKHFEIIKQLWLKDKTIMYLGDWHYHPAKYVNASNTDYESFKENCLSSKTNSKYMFNIITSIILLKNSFLVSFPRISSLKILPSFINKILWA